MYKTWISTEISEVITGCQNAILRIKILTRKPYFRALILFNKKNAVSVGRRMLQLEQQDIIK